MKFTHGILALLIATNLLYGCVPVVVGGAAAGTAVVATSRRSPGAVVDDETIEMKARLTIVEHRDLNSQIHIELSSYNGVVLMTGEAPTAELRSQTENIVKEIPMVRQIYNEMIIAEPSPFKTRANDSLITALVKTELLRITDIEGFNGARVKVVTDTGTVYLMGLLTREEAEAVTEAARRVSGVQKVVKLFEYID